MADPADPRRPGLLESLKGLFHKEPPEPPPAESPEAIRFDAVRAGFEDALRSIQMRAAELEHGSDVAAVGTGASEEEAAEARAAARARERARRIEGFHRAIRDDIAAAHARLHSGLEKTDLEALAAELRELAARAEEGRGSHELLPRARFAIVERLQREAGALAVARIVALLQRAGLSWPDPTCDRRQGEESERSRRRRLAETRETFLAQSPVRTAERMLGVVEVWGADYPDQGSPLWEETVLEGVAAGLRAELVRDCFEVLRRDIDQVLARVEVAIGKQLDALHQLLAGGVASAEQANLALSSSLRVIDEVVPELAWQHIRGQLPSARGEWPD